MRIAALVLFIGALIAIQALIGGARLVFGLPAYALLALAGMALGCTRVPAATTSRKICLGLALLLAGWVLTRAVFSPVGYLARNDAFMVVGTLVAYFAVATYYLDTRSRLTVMGVLLFCALFHTVVGAVQFKENNDFMLLPGIMRPTYGWRASGFYICPNHLAGLLETMALMALSMVFWGQCAKWVRVVVGYAAVMCLAGLAITGSRGGYLSVLFGVVVFAILSLWIVHRLRTGQFFVMLGGFLVGGGLIVGGALFLMLRSDTIADRVQHIYDTQNMRPMMWRAALTQYQLAPVTGTGSGTYVFYGRQFRSPLLQNDPIHVHNDYLELLAEYGLIGVAVCGAFVLMHLGAGVGGIRRIVDTNLRPLRLTTGNDLALVIGAFSGIAALLLHSIVDFNLHIPANTLIVSILFGILASPADTVAGLPSDATAPLQRVWPKWLVIGLSAVLLLCALRLLPGELLAERARVALRDDHNAEALVFAERGLAWEKKNPNLYAYVGEAKHFLTLEARDAPMQRLLHMESAEAYKKALQIFPRDTNLLMKLGEALDLLGQFDEANDVYERAFECDPNFGNVYAYYGRHCQMQRRFKSAERYYRRALELGPWPIASEGLQSIERMKSDPVTQLLMNLHPEPDDLEPAPAGVLRP